MYYQNYNDMAKEMTITEKRAENFSKLISLNVNDKVEKKNNLSYLSWSYAWAEFKKMYPDANYRILFNEQTNLPYFSSDEGIMVFTEVTADEQTYQMWLPVMDGANKAMKKQPYTYTVFNKYKNTQEEKRVEGATMFDINKTIMRCLVKNLAMFGLGLYIYSGEDLPEVNSDALLAEIASCDTLDKLEAVYKKNMQFILSHADLLEAVKGKKAELTAK